VLICKVHGVCDVYFTRSVHAFHIPPLAFAVACDVTRRFLQVIEGSRELITQNQDDFELLLCR
jgi:hypothetical protein